MLGVGLVLDVVAGLLQQINILDLQDLSINLDYSPRYLGHEIASGRSESNVWSVANTD